MSTKTVHCVVDTAPMEFPEGTTGGSWLYQLLDMPTLLIQSQGVSPTTEFDFSGVGEGDYRVTAQRLDGGGAPLGPAVSTDFSIVAGSVSIDVAGSVVVTLL